MTINSTPDQNTINKIQKLLNLGRDGGATEGEANAAMAAAERLMLANNLSMAQIELSGGGAQDSRSKTRTEGKANYRWQRWLMAAIADANFCHLGLLQGKSRIRGGNYRDITKGYQIIGRVSNVTAAQNMYAYLLQTCVRLKGEYESQPGKYASDGALFIEGLAARLAERVTRRHEDLLHEQRQEAERQAKEQAARSSHPAYAGQGNALVVVMDDFAKMEAELNEDMFKGLEPGTTTAKRRAQEADAAARSRRIAELEKEGKSWDVAWYMVEMDWSEEQATKYHEEAEAKYKAREESGEKRKSRPAGKTREDRLNERLYTGAAWDGRRKAETVGLSDQIADGGKGRRIT